MVQGKGTFIIDENIGSLFSESMKNQGLEFDAKLINLEKRQADEKIARMLKSM
ncbi:hypothetical protein NRIC_17460 [Enterococcus florum]|uniref:Uncharacterized protein n=1 Tax=Enterococcus florum TaxID=2480627 RepID=A0A4P5P7A5_9ENTE|nr:hypothetical protein NRIC_17460 [Enterococcus florum]